MKNLNHLQSPVASAMIVACLAILPHSLKAGSQCLAKTPTGEVAKLILSTAGTAGVFQSAELDVRDSRGDLVFEEHFGECQQFAETSEGERTIVVLSAESDRVMLRLRFVGKDQDNDDLVELYRILRDDNRRKDPNNSLNLQINVGGEWRNIGFSDIIVSVVKDV